MTEVTKEEEAVLPAAPREEMVTKAVDFLRNPKVQQSPLSQRKAFLLKKGLTEEEVELAVSRSGVTETTGVLANQSHVSQPQNVVVQYQPPPASKWKDFLSTAVLVGGLSYAVYQLLQKYILPIWFGPSKEERQVAALEMSIGQLQRSLEEMVASMKSVQASIDAQSENVKQVALEAAQNRGSTELQKIQETSGFTEIKQEIASLKGLLLSRKQFPPTPVTQPVIPSWQLASRTDDSKADNSSTPDVTPVANGATPDPECDNKQLSTKSSSFIMVEGAENGENVPQKCQGEGQPNGSQEGQETRSEDQVNGHPAMASQSAPELNSSKEQVS